MKTGFLRLKGWEQKLNTPVEIIGETPKRYQIKVLEDCVIPHNRRKKAGDVLLVPKFTICFDDGVSSSPASAADP